MRDPARLPEHITADEHHADWCGREACIAVTAAECCVLGMALTNAADDKHLEQAYGDFATEARDMNPEYVPQTVDTDGWAATLNAFKSWFPKHCRHLVLPARLPDFEKHLEHQSR